MGRRQQLADAAFAGILTAVRWLVAPLIVIAVFLAVAYGAYDYYVTRTLTREIVAAVNNGNLLKALNQQAQQQAQRPAPPKE